MLRSASTSATTATPGTVYSVEYSSGGLRVRLLDGGADASTVDAIACTRCFACVDWVFDFVRSPPLAFASTASAPSPVVRTNAGDRLRGFASRSGCASLRSADDSPVGRRSRRRRRRVRRTSGPRRRCGGQDAGEPAVGWGWWGLSDLVLHGFGVVALVTGRTPRVPSVVGIPVSYAVVHRHRSRHFGGLAPVRGYTICELAHCCARSYDGRRDHPQTSPCAPHGVMRPRTAPP